jgi:hypothetical protein
MLPHYPTVQCSRLAAIALVFLTPWLVACSEEATDDSSLTVNTFPSSLRIGDTTDAFTCTKQVRNELGRMKTEDSYPAIFFESGDSSVVMPLGRRLLALKKGQTNLVAHDKNSSLKSDSLRLTVE